MVFVLNESGRLNRGDVIGVSALTWLIISAFIQPGLQPMLIDCEIDTLIFLLKRLKMAEIQPNISAIFITNTLGHCDDIAGIKHICEENDILFLRIIVNL